MNEADQMNKTRQHFEQVKRHYTMAPPAFLDAWKAGVKMAGPRLFTAANGYLKPLHTDDVSDKWQLIPDINAIDRYTETCSVSQGVFIGALVSFYNGDTGAAILARFGHTGLGDIANRLELGQLLIITRLMLNHTGW